MIHFTAIVKKFGEKGEKTGWTYFDINKKLAIEIKPDIKKSFRVKGNINNILLEKSSLYPMGDGNFIFAINSEFKRKLKITTGDLIKVEIEFDERQAELPEAFVECLEEDVALKNYFYGLTKTHQSNYKHYMLGAKSENAKAKKIAQVLQALSLKMTPKEMIDAEKARKGL